MTEKQAWLTIAEAYATPRNERIGESYDITGLEERGDGICYALEILYDRRSITMGCLISMENKILDSHLPDCGWLPYFCDYENPANDLLRADYCYFQYYRLGGE